MQKPLPLLIFLLLLASCNEKEPLQEYSGIAMTIPYRVLADHSDIQETIDRTFKEVDLHLNRFNPHSELSHFNQSLANSPFPLSPLLYAMILKTDKLVQMTEGTFDPSVEPLQQLWKKAFAEGHIPSPEEIQPLKKALGWHHLHLNGPSATKDEDLFALDLGGIAKGYAVDLLYERIKALGVKHLYVEWGGEIRVSASHPSGRAWKIAIRPLNEEEDPVIIDLSNQAVATSGDYEQSYHVQDDQGKSHRYFHLFDSKTGIPLSAPEDQHYSITVIAPDCCTADGIATALFFLPENRREVLIKEHPEIQLFTQF